MVDMKLEVVVIPVADVDRASRANAAGLRTMQRRMPASTWKTLADDARQA
jgi:hypothetical protein